jgi:outer membrane protein OmpA-like peptidoglycan-associated protein
MNNAISRFVWSIGLMSVSAAVLAGDPQPVPAKPAPQEPIGFVTGAVIGAFAGGPVGAVVGAGLGTWLGNRVHRAGDAGKAEAKLAVLQTEKSTLLTEKSALLSEKTELAAANQGLNAKLEDLLHTVQSGQSAKQDGSDVLDGMQADVLFRTGSAEITPEIAHQIQVLAEAVAKSPALKVRVDGYADPRGTVDTNMKLSQARADAVRDLFRAAGISDEALEVNAYGKSQSVANDYDGYALERRVRLTLQAQGGAAVAQMGESE